jgi:hypothetical protein
VVLCDSSHCAGVQPHQLTTSSVQPRLMMWSADVINLASCKIDDCSIIASAACGVGGEVITLLSELLLY